MNKTDLENDIKDGLSSYQIAKKYNKGQGTITYWLKKFGLKTKYIIPTFYDKIDWNKCQELYDTGMVWKDLIKRGFPHNGMDWAVKNGKLKTRTVGESRKIGHKNGKYDYSPYRTIEFRKKVAKGGGYRENAGRCAHLTYTKKDGTNVKIQGSWELLVAQFLDEKNFKWSKNKIGYKYIFEGKEHSYFPDFVLDDSDIYIEVKGYETNKDREKWKQFPKKLLIIKKNDIKDLEFWFKNNLLGSKL